VALDYRLCSAVDIGGGLAQYRDSRLCEHGPGKADELALAGGQVLAAFIELGVIAVFQVADEAAGADGLSFARLGAARGIVGRPPASTR
jgi:hypothetical protein